MNKLHKAFLFIISLFGILVSIGAFSIFCYIPFVTPSVQQFWKLSSIYMLNSILFAYIIIALLCFVGLLLLAVFFPDKSNVLILKKSKGKLKFAKQTIESAVRYSYADVDGINTSKVRVKIKKKPEKTQVFVKLSLSDPTKMLGLTETVQEKIEAALQESLGIAIHSINVKVAESNPTNKALTEVRAEPAKEARVI